MAVIIGLLTLLCSTWEQGFLVILLRLSLMQTRPTLNPTSIAYTSQVKAVFLHAQFIFYLLILFV